MTPTPRNTQRLAGGNLADRRNLGNRRRRKRGAPAAATGARRAVFGQKDAITEPSEARMTDTLPDRLCVDPASPHYNEDLLKRDIGIRFNGKERSDVEEYCVSEGWVRVPAGNAKDRFGKPLTLKLKGTVEPFFRD
jgi:hypothetical protein